MTLERGVDTIILTKDEEPNIRTAVRSARRFSRRVFVIDCGSRDRTMEVAQQEGALGISTGWRGFAAQRNWALEEIAETGSWVFFLDADEVVSDQLADEIRVVTTAANSPHNGFEVNRLLRFQGKEIRHSGFFPSWHLRLVRKGCGQYEDRSVHEHFELQGSIGRLDGLLYHEDRRGLTHFITKHNDYSTLEAAENMRNAEPRRNIRLKEVLTNEALRRRLIKRHIWRHLPARYLLRFLYQFILRGGVLDGLTGLHFCLILASYELQIVMKERELRISSRRDAVA